MKGLTKEKRSASCIFCHGLLESRRIGEMWSLIPRCTCSGYTRSLMIEQEEENKRRELEMEKSEREYQKHRLSRLIDSSGLGERFRSRTFDNFRQDTNSQKRAFWVCRTYVDRWPVSSGRGIFIHGSFGTGKTHLAGAVALELMNRGVNVIFRTDSGVLDDIKRTFGGQSEGSTDEVMRIYRECDLLVVDDVGKARFTDWALSVFYDLINHRYESNLPILMTSNYDLRELYDRLGDPDRAGAIISRLSEMCYILPLVGRDYRSSVV